MNNIWYDKIHPEQARRQNEVAMTIGYFTLGLFAPFVVTYRKPSTVRIYLLFE